MPRSTSILLALVILAPVTAGCLTEDPPAQEAPALAQTAEEAGAKSGAAPVAPTEAYAVDDVQTAYPVAVETNPARAPVVVDLSDEFTPTDCRPLGFGPFEEQLSAVSIPRRGHDLSETLRVGDVFSYNITLSFTNAADNWGEIELVYGFGSTVREMGEPVREETDVFAAFEGQGYRASEDDMAWVYIGCDFGMMTRPIPYTLTVTFAFAEGAAPAEAPLLLTVPEGASKLFVRGVAIDGAEGVFSHFRIFRPDDTLLCECGLGAQQEFAEVALPGPGEYVLLVDHTANGFVSVALDVPSDTPIRALASEWAQTSLLANDAGAVDATVELHLDRVPLLMFAFVQPKDNAGLGKRTALSVTNDRGEPLRIAWGGHLAWAMPDGGNAWLGIWPEDWELAIDHHAFAQGHHTATISAETLRGEVILVTREYVR